MDRHFLEEAENRVYVPNTVAVAAAAFQVEAALLAILFLRERKKEIGIYLSLGEKKSKVIAQMMIEVLVVSLIAITLALFVGNILSAGISETMLRNDLVAGRGIDEGVSFGILDQMGVVVDMPVDEMLAGYDVSLDAQTVVTFYFVAIATIIAATILPMLYIVRLNPKEIML